MAKKSVASLTSSSKRLTKVIKMVKKNDSLNYSFVETIISPDQVNFWLKKQEGFLEEVVLKEEVPAAEAPKEEAPAA